MLLRYVFLFLDILVAALVDLLDAQDSGHTHVINPKPGGVYWISLRYSSDSPSHPEPFVVLGRPTDEENLYRVVQMYSLACQFGGGLSAEVFFGRGARLQTPRGFSDLKNYNILPRDNYDVNVAKIFEVGVIVTKVRNDHLSILTTIVNREREGQRLKLKSVQDPRSHKRPNPQSIHKRPNSQSVEDARSNKRPNSQSMEDPRSHKRPNPQSMEGLDVQDSGSHRYRKPGGVYWISPRHLTNSLGPRIPCIVLGRPGEGKHLYRVVIMRPVSYGDGLSTQVFFGADVKLQTRMGPIDIKTYGIFYRQNYDIDSAKIFKEGKSLTELRDGYLDVLTAIVNREREAQDLHE